MKSRIDGSFIFTLFLGLFVLVCLIYARDFPDSLQIATNLAGYTTLALICVLLAGAFYPEILHWTETALQDLWGASGQDKGAVDAVAEEAPPWPAVLKSIGYAVGFLLFSFLFGFFVVPPIFLATYLIAEAKVRPLWAILAGVIATAILDTGMMMVYVEVWAGIIPEIFEGYIGGAIMPPL
ncbi:MAG: hypothetical protein ACE10H_00615 [Candidatus Binatia bacterium]